MEYFVAYIVVVALFLFIWKRFGDLNKGLDAALEASFVPPVGQGYNPDLLAATKGYDEGEVHICDTCGEALYDCKGECSQTVTEAV